LMASSNSTVVKTHLIIPRMWVRVQLLPFFGEKIKPEGCPYGFKKRSPTLLGY
jgi:hypothetical protein